MLSAENTSGVAQQILQGNNAVVVVPRTVLAQGTYSVSANTSARNVSWSFTVDPAAATGAIAPVSVAQPSAPATGLAPLAPARIVDTRSSTGASRLTAGIPARIQVTGQGGVPSDAKAVLANVTVTGPAGSGFLTMWNCSAARPEVSTLNFSANETIANAATIPLDGAGQLCAFSSQDADLVIDVGGYYSTSASGRYMPVSPVRLMDSREGIGTPGTASHPARSSSFRSSVLARIPSSATAVALNVTGILPNVDAFITAFPCGAMPPTSSLNPAAGKVTPNLVIAQVSPTGTVCFFTNTDIDLVVDVVGFVSLGDPRIASPPARRSGSPTPATPPAPRSMPARPACAWHPARRWSCRSPACEAYPPMHGRSPPT